VSPVNGYLYGGYFYNIQNRYESSNYYLDIVKRDFAGNVVATYQTGQYKSSAWEVNGYNNANGLMTLQKSRGYSDEFVVVNITNGSIVNTVSITRSANKLLYYSGTHGVAAANIGYTDGGPALQLFSVTGQNKTSISRTNFTYPISEQSVTMEHNHSVGVVTTFRIDASIKKTITFLNDTQITSSDSVGYIYNQACYDNFGNIVFGGKGGRVFVRASSGVISTDTNFYSDYMMGNIVDKAEAARAAAKNAETKTNQLYDYVTGLNLDNLNSKVEKLSSRMTGNINAVYTQNGATATTSDISPPISVNASGVTHFELSIDGANWVGPYQVSSSGTIALNKGVNTVRVRAYHEDLPNVYVYSQKTLFRL